MLPSVTPLAGQKKESEQAQGLKDGSHGASREIGHVGVAFKVTSLDQQRKCQTTPQPRPATRVRQRRDRCVGCWDGN